MRIASDGTWFHEGSPIGRKPMVELFSSILLREEDGRHYLVTPIEKVGIRVDDAPFVAVGLEVQDKGGGGQTLTFTTNVGDEAVAGPEHGLRFETDTENGGLKPYLHVRGRLEALVSRALTYDLVELAEDGTVDGQDWLGIRSAGVFFPMARAGTDGR